MGYALSEGLARLRRSPGLVFLVLATNLVLAALLALPLHDRLERRPREPRGRGLEPLRLRHGLVGRLARGPVGRGPGLRSGDPRSRVRLPQPRPPAEGQPARRPLRFFGRGRERGRPGRVRRRHGPGPGGRLPRPPDLPGRGRSSGSSARRRGAGPCAACSTARASTSAGCFAWRSWPSSSPGSCSSSTRPSRAGPTTRLGKPSRRPRPSPGPSAATPCFSWPS